MKLRLIIYLFILGVSTLMGQVSSVSYVLDYNATTRLYDLSLLINKGQAVKPKERIQFNAQVSIIVPSNVNLEVAKAYMPIINNINFDGSQPQPWEVANKLQDVPDLQNNKIYSIIPRLSQTSFYNKLSEGDKIKLFSLEVFPLPQDKSSIRLYSNSKDAPAKKTHGSDFSNGFTLGGVNQLYNEEVTTIKNDLSKTEISEFVSKVYPNPAIDYINIEVSTPGEAQINYAIYDINGKLISKKSMLKKSVGHLSIPHQVVDLSSGLYTVIVEVQGQQQEHKMIILEK
jgi:hypothetical protein